MMTGRRGSTREKTCGTVQVESTAGSRGSRGRAKQNTPVIPCSPWFAIPEFPSEKRSKRRRKSKRRREEKVRRESPSFSFFPTPRREASAFYGPLGPRRKKTRLRRPPRGGEISVTGQPPYNSKRPTAGCPATRTEH